MMTTSGIISSNTSNIPRSKTLSYRHITIMN